MRITFRIYLLLSVVVISTGLLKGQDTTRTVRLGLSFARGSQQMFPYNDKDYTYSFNGYKIIINFPIKTGKISYELHAEPAIYSSHHQLLNKYYIQPEAGDDYLLQREIYTQEKTIIEYALNLGILIRYNFRSPFSLSFIASVGPMYSGTATERLAKGFAFSDIVAIGAAYKVKNLMFEVRPGVRHVSNADLKMPNAGHNAATIDFGISVFL